MKPHELFLLLLLGLGLSCYGCYLGMTGKDVWPPMHESGCPQQAPQNKD